MSMAQFLRTHIVDYGKKENNEIPSLDYDHTNTNGNYVYCLKMGTLETMSDSPRELLRIMRDNQHEQFKFGGYWIPFDVDHFQDLDDEDYPTYLDESIRFSKTFS